MPRGVSIAVLAVCGLAVAGCGSRSASPPAEPPTTATPPPAVSAPDVAPHLSRVVLSIRDGDTRRPVAGATVRVGSHAARTNARGRARIVVRRLASLPVVVSRRGFAPLRTRVQFRRAPRRTLLLYRQATQWRMYGVDPQRTQVQPQIRLRPPFRLVWSRGMGSLVEFPAAVVDGIAYLANLHGVLWALSMADGRVLWRFDMQYREQDSSPAVVGDWVVEHSKGGRVWVLDRRTGKPLWSYGASSLIESSPVVLHGVDYFGDWAGNVYALDLVHRRLLWRRSFGAKITSSMAVLGNTLFFGDYAGRVWAISKSNGAVRWSGGVNGRVYGTPAVGGGRVFVPSSDGNSLTAFTTSGDELWRLQTGGYVYSSPALLGGHVYVGSYDGYLYCVSAATGRVDWARPMGGAVSGAPVIVDGIVYAGSFAHRIVGFDAGSGNRVFTFPHGEYVPLSGNGGRLLLVGYNRVYAVEPRR